MKRIQQLILLLLLSVVSAKAQDRIYSFTGNVDNDLATGNDGTISGTVTYIADRFGAPNAAVSIGGANSSINFGVMDSLNGVNNFTIAAWFQRAPAGYQRAMYSNGTKLFAYLDVGGNTTNVYHTCTQPLATGYLTVPGSTTVFSSIPVGQWFHFALVLRNGWLYSYINGSLYSTAAFNGATCAANGDFILGEAVPNIAAANNWLGGVDDLFILSEGLTSTQVDSIKNLPNPCSAYIPITTQPSNVTVTTNSTVQFSTASTGFGLSYQWQSSIDDGLTYTNLVANSTYSNVNTATLSVAAQDSLNGRLFRAEITDGFCTVFTNPARLSYPIKVDWLFTGSTNSTTGTNPFVSMVPSGTIAPTYVADRFGNPSSAYSITRFLTYENVTTSNLNFLANTREFSFSAWYLVANNATLMYCPGGPNAIFRASVNGALAQQPIFEFNTGSNISSVINSNGNNTATQWRHFVVTFKQGVAKMYVNGLLVSQSICSQKKMPSSFSSFAITNTYVSTNYFLNGSFDDVTVCNWVMTQSEIDSLYNAPNPCQSVIPITAQPSDVYLDAAATTTFSVATSASGVTYQWYRSTDNGANYSIVTDGGAFSGATTATLTVVADTSFAQNRFRCHLSNGASCTGLQSYAARLHVSKPIKEVLYPLDAGSANEVLGSGMNGSIFGTVNAVADRFGTSNGAMRMNNGSYVSIGNPAFVNASNELTFNGWFRKEENNTKFFMSKTNTFLVRQDLAATFNGTASPSLSASGLAVWQNIPDSAWYMQTLVFKNGTMNSYVNGVLVASASSTNFVTETSADNLVFGGKIGQIAPSPNPTFGIDDIYLGNRAWTSTKVDSVYQATRACNVQWATQPTTAQLYYNDTITLTATPSLVGTLVWQVSTDNGATYSNLSNAAPYSNVNTGTLTIAATPNIDGNLYRLLLTTPNCSAASNSAAVKLTKDVAYNFNNQTPQNILGTNNQGTLSPGVTYSTDRFNNDSAAISVDAASNYMLIGNLAWLNEASQFSYVGWYKKPTSPTATGELFSVKARNNWTANQEPNEYLRAYLSNNVIFARASNATAGIVDPLPYTNVNPNEWFQFAYIVDYPSFKIYINGKLYAQQTLTKPLMNITSGMDIVPDGALIGAYHNTAQPSWSSDIDDIYISSKALTVAQLDSMRALPNPCPASTSNTTTPANMLICNGATAELSVRNTGVNYNWYDAPVSGNLLGSGINYTTASLVSDTTFYVEAIMPGCSTVNARTPIMVDVKPIVNNATDATPTANLTLCPGQTTTLTATADSGSVVFWWDAPTAGNVLAASNSFVTPAVNSTQSFYAAVTNGTCASSNRTQVEVFVDSNKTAALSILPFSCPTNISGALYRFPLKAVSPGIVSIGTLTREAVMGDTTTILVVPNTTYTVTANDNGCLASTVVTSPAFTPDFIAVANSVCQSCAIRNNKTYTLFDIASSQKLLTVNDVNNGVNLGHLDACVNVDTAFVYGTNTFLGRNFHITPDTSSTAVLRLFFTPAEVAALQAINPSANTSSLYVTAFDGQAETPLQYDSFTVYGPFAALTEVVGNYYIDVPINGFSGFYISAQSFSAPLAVSAIDISVTNGTDYPVVHWSNAQEDNTASYVVEHSTNASQFAAIANQTATGETKYQLTHTTATEGVNFYRIKSIGKNGDVQYSNIVSTILALTEQVQVYPNPATGKITVSAKDFVQCDVISMQGKVIMTSTSKTLDIATLDNGVYFIKVKGRTSSATVKIVKQ
ncbi:MAG: hypothetical protein RL660_1371 [Bacteroidota bacterium]|jgi:hypothetical protein